MTLPNQTRSLPEPANYCPYSLLGDQPNIIVDGQAQRATVLTLSHWPWTDTPKELMRDTSTDIVFAYLDNPEFYVPANLVSNSHYDEDGLLSMYGLVDPENAIKNRSLLISTSRAGDFAFGTDEDAVKLSFVLAAHADPDWSPLPADTFGGSDAEQIHSLYSRMLDRLPSLIDDIPGNKEYWEPELTHWRESEQAIDDGHVVIDELPELDLAIVRIPESMPAKTVRRYLRKWQRSVHPFAVHNITQCSRIVWIKGQSIEMQYRYESWVQLASRRPMLRVDLSDIARQLSDIETAGGEWVFEGVNEVAPRLMLSGSCRSSVSPELFIQYLCRALEKGPPAWNPYKRTDE